MAINVFRHFGYALLADEAADSEGNVVKTYKRVCVKTWNIEAQNGDYFEVERGKEYTTSEEKDGHVVVFSNFWVPVPVECFAGEQVFTKS